MKKIFLILLALPLFFTGCSPDDPVYSDGNFVAFTRIDAEELFPDVLESYELDVAIAEPLNEDLIIDIEITDNTAEQGLNYEAPQGQIIIPAGEVETTIEGVIYVLEDTTAPEGETTVSFNIEIVGTNQDIKIGLGDPGTKNKRISIFETANCDSQFYEWLGEVEVEDVGFATVEAFGETTEDAACDVLLFNDTDFMDFRVTNYTFIFNAQGDGSSGIVQGSSEILEGVSEDPNLGPLNGQYIANGFYDVATGEIEVSYEFQALTAEANEEQGIDEGEVVGNFFTGTNIIRNNN